mgnify:CR=1 FL=1
MTIVPSGAGPRWCPSWLTTSAAGSLGLCAFLEPPRIDPKQSSRVACQQFERARHRDHPVPHQVERERQQRLCPGHAGFGIGKGKSLVLRPARIVARGDHVDGTIGDRCDHCLAVRLAPQRR